MIENIRNWFWRRILVITTNYKIKPLNAKLTLIIEKDIFYKNKDMDFYQLNLGMDRACNMTINPKTPMEYARQKIINEVKYELIKSMGNQGIVTCPDYLNEIDDLSKMIDKPKKHKSYLRVKVKVTKNKRKRKQNGI